MSGIKYLIGNETICDSPLEPYADIVCRFAADLSDTLMKEASAKAYPDVMAFAFWCRKGNIQALKRRFGSEEKRLGRGLAFHIAPSNVPVNFAFTYLFSLLAGNATIVRVPSRSFPQTEILCHGFKQVLENYPEIKKRTAFIQYPAENAITEQFCAKADVRVIWGGDETIREIRKCPVKPRCIDVVFADRYSLCILDGASVLKASEAEICSLAEKFYNDTYLMDQNACSSPQLICWRNEREEAKERFWHAVAAYAKSRYSLQAASAMDKYTQLCCDSIGLEYLGVIRRVENLLYCVELKKLPTDITALRGKCGYFYEYTPNTLTELADSMTEKIQTVTYYGADADEIQEFVISSHIKGIDRIVPVGKALDIGVIWDGYDLVRTMSRIVDRSK
ncbi:MAG: acyl-CoA reductase [Lachnospiraceae bacterium]|nr:acyl-CoA reductase [Lachnospiraceae bacterium]